MDYKENAKKHKNTINIIYIIYRKQLEIYIYKCINYIIDLI